MGQLIQAGWETHNYLQLNPVAALYYFSGLDSILKLHGQYFGILAFQMVSIVFPRAIFPSKPASDVVRIMSDKDQIAFSAEYDPFFEKMADGGIPGVIFYSFLPMLITAILTKASLKSKYPGIQLLGVGVFTLNTATVFLSTRGPYIVLSWTALPSMFLAALMCLIYLRKRIILTQ